MKSKYLALLAGGLIGALAPAAMSACTYSYDVQQGAPVDLGNGDRTVQVRVFLKETLTDGSTSFSDSAAQYGLSYALIQVQKTGGDAAKITAVTRNAADFADPDSGILRSNLFSTWTAASSPNYVAVQNGALAFDPNYYNPDDPYDLGPRLPGVMFNGGSIWMADLTVTFPAGTNTAQYSLDVPSPGYIYTNGLASLDLAPDAQDASLPQYPAGTYAPFTPVSFQVAVPEPTTLGLVLVSGLMLLRRR